MTYDLKPLKAPRVAGTLLRAFVTAMENPVTAALLSGKLLADSGIAGLRKRSVSGGPDACPPIFNHQKPPASPGSPPDLAAIEAVPLPTGEGFRPESASDFVGAYAEGRTTPVQIAERILEIVQLTERHEPPLRLLIAQRRDDLQQQAEASARRYREGRPLGPLDGVPVAVKDEIDQTPYSTTVGTRFLGVEPAAEDATVVARLRAAGALLLGKANMHEIGLGVTGLNPHHGAARNPYDPARATGGSSSGSAACVGAGLCPIAVGADGGGSVRIPASFCGQVGLKATFGRTSEHGAAELCWSVAHIGPIAATVRDCALAYAVMAGPDPRDPNTLRQPAVRLDELGKGELSGVRLGIFRPWFEDAEPAVVSACARAVDLLEQAGAAVEEITIRDLELARVAHIITISTEMATTQMPHLGQHRDEYGLDVRLNLALAGCLTASDYVHAQRHRARLYRDFDKLYRQVDVIVTPTVACTAPILSEDALTSGESNLELTGRVMRFTQVANLLGYPAVSVPVGYDRRGLPIGLQLMGRGWEEHLLLRLAAAIEQRCPRIRPAIHHRYLG